MFKHNLLLKNTFQLICVFLAFQVALETARLLDWFEVVRVMYSGIAQKLFFPRPIYSSSAINQALNLRSDYSLGLSFVALTITTAFLACYGYEKVIRKSFEGGSLSGFGILGCVVAFIITNFELSGELEYLVLMLISCVVGLSIVTEKNKTLIMLFILLYGLLYYSDNSSRFPLLIIAIAALMCRYKHINLSFLVISVFLVPSLLIIDQATIGPLTTPSLIDELFQQLLRSAILSAALDSSSTAFQIYNEFSFFETWFETFKPRILFNEKMVIAFPKEFSNFMFPAAYGYESFWLSPGIFVYADRNIVLLIFVYLLILSIFLIGIVFIRLIDADKYARVWLIYFAFMLVVMLEANPFFFVPGMIKFYVLLIISSTIYDKLAKIS